MSSSARPASRYQELLKQAEEARKRPKYLEAEVVDGVVPRPWVREDVGNGNSAKSMTPRELAEFKNKIPFTEEM